MTQPPDHYKERELKYKRFDVYFRAIGALAAVASAIAAFPVLKNVFSPEPASVQKSSIVTPSTPAVINQQPTTTTGFTKSNNQTVQQLPQVVPSKTQPSLQRDRDDDDDNDDHNDNDDKRGNKRDDND